MASFSCRSYAMNGIDYEIYIYIDRNGTPWFKANEIAMILGYSNLMETITIHVDKEDQIRRKDIESDDCQLPAYWHPYTVFINESGLYSLMLHSKKPQAKEFKRWITSEVLPSIRKTGSYTVQSLQPSNTELVNSLKEIVNFNRRIVAKMIEDKPRLAVMPKSNEKKYKFSILSNGRKLKFCRTQERYFKKSVKRNRQQCLQLYIIC